MGVSRSLASPLVIHRGLQGVILGVVGAGLLMANVSVVVNAVLGLGATALPTLVRRDLGVHLDPRLTLWVSTAVALHALGMAVLYDLVPWWDHLTHLLSGALVAGVAYVAIRTVEEHVEGVTVPATFRGVVIVAFTLVVGVAWEVIEHVGRDLAIAYGMEPILQVYGPRDTALDLIFDGLGGLIVAVAGGRYFEGTVRALRDRFGSGEA